MSDTQVVSTTTTATVPAAVVAKLDIIATAKAAGKKAKYVLKQSPATQGDKLIDIGDVYEGENGLYAVEGSELIIGRTDDEKLLLKAKNDGSVTNEDGTSPKYVTLGRLFFNEKKKDGTPCKPHFSAKTLKTIGSIKEGTRFVMFPNTPRVGGAKRAGGFRRN